MRRCISRHLLAYYCLALLLTGSMYVTYRVWHQGGKEDRKMAAAQLEGRHVAWRYYVSVYGPRALLINVGLSGFLLLAGPWAARKLELTGSVSSPAVGGKAFVCGTTALVLAASALWSAPRLSQSLWTDEATAMLRFMVGEYVQDDAGQWHLAKVAPERRQFYMLTPNNHMLYSTLAGLTHEWLAPEMKEAGDYYFSEWALRLPAFLSGLLALCTLAWLARELGLGQRVVLVAVVLLALHPWHAQYLALARGYSLVMACIPAFLAAALRALRTGRWRWWLATALPQVVMVDTWPLAADVVIVGNACIFALLLLHRWSKEERLTQLARWAVVSLLAGMAVYQLLAPALPQIALYMQNNARYKADLMGFVVNPWLALFTGQGWVNIEPENPYVFGWVTTLSRTPWFIIQPLVLVVCFCIGMRKLWAGGYTQRCIALFVLSVPLVVTLHLLASHFVFLPWYGVPALPGIVLTSALGFCTLLDRHPLGMRWVAPALLVLLAVCWAPQHLALKAVPGGCNRESAQITRKILNPLHPDYGKESLTTFIGALYKGYDNLALQIDSQADLEKYMQLAQAEKRPLYVNLGRQNILLPEQIKVRHFLENSGQFIMHGPLYGWEPEATRWVFEWRQR